MTVTVTGKKKKIFHRKKLQVFSDCFAVSRAASLRFKSDSCNLTTVRYILLRGTQISIWATHVTPVFHTLNCSEKSPKNRPKITQVCSLTRYHIVPSFIHNFCWSFAEYILAQTLIKEVVYFIPVTVAPKLSGITLTHAPPWGRPYNSLGPVWANVYLDLFSTATPAGIDIDSPVCVKSERPKGRILQVYRMKHPNETFATKLLVSLESPVPPHSHWKTVGSLRPRFDCGWFDAIRTPKTLFR